MDALATIQRLGQGRLLESLHSALVATSEEVVETGKPGTITLKLTVSNHGQGDELVTVNETLSRTSPKRPSRGAIFYAVEGELHRDDPRQTKMDFRLVEPDSEVREPKGREREERAV
jgi:hypothetical protein